MIPNKPSDSTATSGGVHTDFSLAETPDRPTVLSCQPVKIRIGLSCLGGLVPVIPVGLDDQRSRPENEIGLQSSEHRLVSNEFETALPKFMFQDLFNAAVDSGEPLAHPTLNHKGAELGIAPTFLHSLACDLRHFLAVFRITPLPNSRFPLVLPALFGGLRLEHGVPHFLLKTRIAPLLQLAFPLGFPPSRCPPFLKSLPHTATVPRGSPPFAEHFLGLLSLARIIPSSMRRCPQFLARFGFSFINTLGHFMFNYNTNLTVRVMP